MGRGRRGSKRGSYKNQGSRNTSSRGRGNFKNKRKSNRDGDGKKDAVSDSKRQKLQPEKENLPTVVEPSSSSESEEEVKPYTQLLSMFKSSNRAQQVLTSDEDESEDIDSDDKSEVADSRGEEDDVSKLGDEEMEEEDESSSLGIQEDSEVEDNDKEDEDNSDEEPSVYGEESEQELSGDEKESEQEQSGDEEEVVSSTDPYHLHYDREMSESLLEVLTSPKPYETQEQNWKTLGRMVVHLPAKVAEKIEKPKLALLEDTMEKYVVPGTLPQLRTGIPLVDYGVKSQLCANLDRRPLSNNITQTADEVFSPLQHELFSLTNDYRDIYYPEMNHLNSDEIRTVYCLHSLNHVMKSRDKVLLHNAKLKKYKESGQSTEDVEFRDQGLVRPRVLIIAPLRNSAVK